MIGFLWFCLRTLTVLLCSILVGVYTRGVYDETQKKMPSPNDIAVYCGLSAGSLILGWASLFAWPMRRLFRYPLTGTAILLGLGSCFASDL